MQLGKHSTQFVESMEELKSANGGRVTGGNYLIDSPLKGGKHNLYNFTDETGVVCVAKYCGIPFGTFSNSTYERSYLIGDRKIIGSHAEDCFMLAWEEFLELPIYREIELLRQSRSEKPVLTLKLSKSPCEKCTEKLIMFKDANKDLEIRLKVLQMYEGREGGIGSKTHRLSLLALMNQGFAVKEWVIFNLAKKQRTKTKSGFQHELSNVTSIFLSNEFTELIFNDPDEKEKDLSEGEK